MKKRIPNKKSKTYVETLTPFIGSNLKSILMNRLYVVYSYNWYPIIIYDFSNEKWIKNITKYSPSTSRHLTECTPNRIIFEQLEFEKIKQLYPNV